MSNELNIQTSVILNKGNVKNQGLKVTGRVDQTGDGYQSGTVVIGSGATVALPVDDLTTPGIYAIQVVSADSAATLQVGPDVGGSVISPMDELNETEVSNGRISSSATVLMKAVGGSVTAEYFVAEE